jgi:hypothetical protein
MLSAAALAHAERQDFNIDVQLEKSTRVVQQAIQAVSGNAPEDEEVGQNVDHIDRLEPVGETDPPSIHG